MAQNQTLAQRLRLRLEGSEATQTQTHGLGFRLKLEGSNSNSNPVGAHGEIDGLRGSPVALAFLLLHYVSYPD